MPPFDGMEGSVSISQSNFLIGVVKYYFVRECAEAWGRAGL